MSVELRFHSESYGREVQILEHGDLFAAHDGFVTRRARVQWAELEREAMGRR